MSVVQTFDDVKICADQLVQVKDKECLDEFVCKICLVHVVGSGPQLTKCSHLFCGDCLQQWFSTHPSNQTWAQRAKTKGAIPCPVCKTMLHKESDVYPVEQHGNSNSLQLWRMIQSLQIKCNAKHTDGGTSCAWTGEYGCYKKHLMSGTCCKAEFGPKTDSWEELIEEGSYSLEECKKESQYSSTCSEISTDNALDELHIDSAGDGSGTDESECVELLDSPANYHAPVDLSSPIQEELLAGSAIDSHGSVETDLTSLIQNLINVNANDSGSEPDLPEQAFFPDPATEQQAGTATEQPLLMLPPGLEDFTKVSFEAPSQVNRASIAPPLASKASKGGKSKKQKQTEPNDTPANTSQVAGKQMTSEQLQKAYQWQVAQYQMAYAQQYQLAMQRSANAACNPATAYAQQYQMALQAARMQQVAQYYQQAQQATGMR